MYDISFIKVNEHKKNLCKLYAKEKDLDFILKVYETFYNFMLNIQKITHTV